MRVGLVTYEDCIRESAEIVLPFGSAAMNMNGRTIFWLSLMGKVILSPRLLLHGVGCKSQIDEKIVDLRAFL